MIQRNLELMLKTLEMASLIAERTLEIAQTTDESLTVDERLMIDDVRQTVRVVVASIQRMELPI